MAMQTRAVAIALSSSAAEEEQIQVLEARRERLTRMLRLQDEVMALEARVIFPEMIWLAELVADHWEVGMKDLWGNRREESVSEARQALFWTARNRLGMRLQAIGRACGKDHTTVLYGVKRIEDLRATDRAFAADFERFLDRVNAEITNRTNERKNGNGN